MRQAVTSTSSHPSPFHPGEQEIQTRLGMRERMEQVGQKVIRDYMPDQHREFFASLPFLIVGTADQNGLPWASILIGKPGFIQSPDSHTLQIQAQPIFGDPLHNALAPQEKIGLLGIELSNRRRNRANGIITQSDDSSISIFVNQSFGNCPKYIQKRQWTLTPEVTQIGQERAVTRTTHLTTEQQILIAHADTFFIASASGGQSDNPAHGLDVSHRGGKPGFVRVIGDRILVYPDYLGNFMFNTLGNIVAQPETGLLFLDFESGATLQLTGQSEIIWDQNQIAAIPGAQRLVSFQIEESILVKQAVPVTWRFLEYSPVLDKIEQ